MKRFKIYLLLIFCSSAFSIVSYAARVDTLNVFSASMQKTLKVAIVVPDTYKKSKKLFPVLYLLHGGQGSFRDWLTKTPDPMLLHKLADQYSIIIVNPEGGLTSYYFDSPLDKGSQFETFIYKEVVEKIDGSYTTIKDRKGRIIAGLSMGGHGAMYIAAKHPRSLLRRR